MVMIADDKIQDQWSDLVARVQRGEQVLIVRNGQPLVKLVAPDVELPPPQTAEQVRQLFAEIEEGRQQLVSEGRAFSIEEILDIVREGRQ